MNLQAFPFDAQVLNVERNTNDDATAGGRLGFASLMERRSVYDDSPARPRGAGRRHSGYYVKRSCSPCCSSWACRGRCTDRPDRSRPDRHLDDTRAHRLRSTSSTSALRIFTSMDYYLTLAIVFKDSRIVSFYISQGGVGLSRDGVGEGPRLHQFIASAGVHDWFLSHLLWEKCADTTGIVDAAEVIAYQEGLRRQGRRRRRRHVDQRRLHVRCRIRRH